MTTSQFEVAGKRLDCQIKRKDVRHTYLKVKPDFQLEIILPRNKCINADRILEKKRRWIEKKVEELSNTKKLFNDDHILYRGEYIRIKVLTAKKPREGVRLYKKVIFVYENSNKDREQILADFISDHTLAYVKRKAPELASELRVNYNCISTKKMRKWGYCTRDGNLFFNCRLICLPQRLTDYIILHELLHRRYFNHSKQFKNALSKYFEDRKQLEAMLKIYVTN